MLLLFAKFGAAMASDLYVTRSSHVDRSIVGAPLDAAIYDATS
jgi:hypothetical protein